MILLLNADKFILWCDNNNNTNVVKFTITEHNFDNFYTFIERHYISKKLLNNLDKMHKILKSSIEGKTILNTCRMTAIELN